MKGGFVGVDIFFVISGYLITGVILKQQERGTFSILDFYQGRMRRIFPALATVLAVSAMVGFFLLGSDEFKELGREIAAGGGFVANLLLWHETGYFDQAAAAKPLLNLWSLGVEEQFYIFWPLTLLLSDRAKKRLFFIVFTIGLGSLLSGLELIRHDQAAAFFAPYARFWELTVGALLAASQNGGRAANPRPTLRHHLMSATGLTLIVAALGAFDGHDPFPGWRALVPTAGAWLIIAAGPRAWPNARLLAQPLAVAIGLISYPLYLWHWPALAFTQIFDGEPPTRTERVALLVASFVLAALTYYLVEKPLRFGGRVRGKILGLAAAMFAIVSLGWFCDRYDGFAARFGAERGLMQALSSDRLIDEWRKQVRTGTCHLQALELDQHGSSCIETKRPLVMLWGDSHAAALSLGFRALQMRLPFGFAQLTQASCPPLFGIDGRTTRPNCESLNETILSQAASLRPDIILLDSAWLHRDFTLKTDGLASLITASVARIHQEVPLARIAVIGPVPRWTSPLPGIYRRALVLHRPLPAPWSSEFLDPTIFAADDALKWGLADAKIPYISVIDVLCQGDGPKRACLSRLGNAPGDIAYVDAEHLGEKASTYVVDRIQDRIAWTLPGESLHP